MCDELAEAMLVAFLAHAAIRDPNAFSMNIHGAGRRLAHLFFRPGSREKRPMHESNGRLAEGVRVSLGKTRRPCRPRHRMRCHYRDETLPARSRRQWNKSSDTAIAIWARGAKTPCRSSHIAATARHKLCADPRILRRAPQFVVGLRLQRDAHTLDTLSDRRRCRTVREGYRYANNCREPRAAERGKAALPSPDCCRIEDAFHFVRITGLRLHYRADPIQLEVRYRRSPSQTCNDGFDHPFGFVGSRTSMDTTPACLAG